MMRAKFVQQQQQQQKNTQQTFSALIDDVIALVPVAIALVFVTGVTHRNVSDWYI